MYSHHNTEKKFLSFAQQHIEGSYSSLLVGLSGGADSVVLLRLLKAYCDEKGMSLFALHVNHMIRGNEAIRDENFCKKLCSDLGVSLKCVSVDVPSIAKKEKKGLEEAARDERYAALYTACDEFSADAVALAHNATDNLETVIINIARGSSARGAMGIPPIRGRILRPLIEVSGDEIRKYASIMQYDFIEDSTNSDTHYTRNKIRHLVIPVLKEINHDAEGAVTRLSRLLRQDSSYLDDIASEYDNVNDTSVLASLDSAILGRIIRRRVKYDVSFYHISKITDLLKNSVIKSNYAASLDLPCGTRAVISDRTLSFVHGGIPAPTAYDPYCIRLTVGLNILPSGGVIVISDENGNENEFACLNSRYNHCHSDEIYCDGELFARTRAEGDTIFVRGASRKIKKLYNEMKLPLEARGRYPLITSNGCIVWLPGYSVSDNYAKIGINKKKFHMKYFF